MVRQPIHRYLIRLAAAVVCVLAPLAATFGNVQAAPAFIQQQGVYNTGVTTVTATLPSTATANNLLVAVCAAAGSATISTPSGYTQAINQTGTISQAIFYKTAIGNETALTCNFSSSNTSAAHIYEYSGLHGYQSFEAANVTASTGSGSSVSSGSVTTVHANDMLFAAMVINSDNGTPTGSWANSFTDRGAFGTTSGPKPPRAYFDAADLSVSSAGSYSTSVSVNTAGNWRGQIVAFRTLSASPSLSGDMVNGSGVSIASPSVTFPPFAAGFSCQTSTGTLASATQKIRITSSLDSPLWTLAIAATSGPTARWTRAEGSETYDFNDASGSGCTNGQLSTSTASGVITPQTNCTTSNISIWANSSFVQGSQDALTIAKATNGSPVDCYWDITGINLVQKVPANQINGNYTINLTMTVTNS